MHVRKVEIGHAVLTSNNRLHNRVKPPRHPHAYAFFQDPTCGGHDVPFLLVFPNAKHFSCQVTERTLVDCLRPVSKWAWPFLGWHCSIVLKLFPPTSTRQ